MLEVTKCAPMESLLDLKKAFERFFKKQAGYPVFKRKGMCDSFRITMDGGNFALNEKSIRLPKIGLVKTAEPIRWPNAKFLSVTIRMVADRWYAAVNVELVEVKTDSSSDENQVRTVGVDLGLLTFATLSTGEKVDHPRYLKSSLSSLRRLSQCLARKQTGSHNAYKTKIKLGHAYAKIGNQRRFFLHKLTTRLCGEFGHVKIEDLNVKGMIGFGRLARSVYESGFHEFKRQLEYKASKLTVCDRFFPSSKLCSHCGFKLEKLPLSTRHWTCSKCGTVHDRDCNAANNLKDYGGILPLSACGDLRKSVSTKQEILAGG